MRKIEQQMINAITNGENFSKDNTMVRINGLGGYIQEVCLHGNLIIRGSRGNYQISLAGWDTVTTKSRINAFLSMVAPNYRIYTKNHTTYLSDGKKPVVMDNRKFYNVK